jgi:hypothetical protein
MNAPAVPPQSVSSDSSAGLSEGARIINTFTSPSATFVDLKRKPSWFVPFVLISLFSYALVFAAVQKIGWEQINENQLRLNHKQMERIESMPPEQQASARSLGVTITKGISYAIPVFILVIFLIIAAVLMATFNFGLGAEVPFAQAFAIVMYAHLPGIVRAILAIVAIYAGAAPESFIMQNPVASNPGAFVDASQHIALYTFLSALDVITIWTLVLTGIGFACVSKVKRGTAIGVVLGWYALITLVQTAFAAATA